MAKNLRKETLPLVSDQVNLSENAFTWQGLLSLLLKNSSDDGASRSFLLRVVQPGLSGLMDGSVSTLAPIFATAFPVYSLPGWHGLSDGSRHQYGLLRSAL
jgi:hypothetical protein